MKEIPLTKGYVALVDDEDFEWLNKFKWCANRSKKYNRVVAIRNSGRVNGVANLQLMHRAILNLPARWPVVDHIDGNALNNQRSNLRIATQSENMRNRGKNKNNSSGYKGVYTHRKSGLFAARIWINSKARSLGTYKTKEEAAVAYNIGAIKYHGEFAKLNEGPELEGVIPTPCIIQSNNTSGFRGVQFREESSRWSAVVNRRRLGSFNTPEEAARAYDAKAKEVFGDRARLNFPTSDP